MEIIDYYINLRESIIEIISGVKNSNGWLNNWDNTTSNRIIRRKLENLLKDYTNLASNYGVYVVTRYITCNNKNHDSFPAIYPTYNHYGFHIPYKDKNFVWSSDRIYEGNRISICPCSPTNKVNENYVVDDIVYRIKADNKHGKSISEILGKISDAIIQSGDNNPRSGIRENLLLALLIINDSLLPKSVDDYILEVKTKN